MDIDWSTTEVVPLEPSGAYEFQVVLRGDVDDEFTESFEYVAGMFAGPPTEVSIKLDGHRLSYAQFGERDVAACKQSLTDFLEKVESRAAPLRASRERDEQRRREEDARRAAIIEEMIKQFREG